MKTKKESRTAEEKKKALKAALREAGLDAWSPESPAPEPAGSEEPAKGDHPSSGGEM